MDFRAVLAFLCLLAAQANCGPVQTKKLEALAETIQMLREGDLRSTLKNLIDHGQLPNIPCIHLNTTELGEPQEQLLTAYHLSSFSCYINKLSQLSQLSELFEQLPGTLRNISQSIKTMEELLSDRSAGEDCSLSSFGTVELCVYLKCLLQHLDKRLSNARF